MPEGLNQHFVPQYYFRNFSKGESCIHLLLKKSSKIVYDASIKGQCAKHKLYGGPEIEKIFANLDSRHSKAIKDALFTAWKPNIRQLDVHSLAWLWEAILFQRARTTLQAEKMAPVMEKLMLECFKEYLLHDPDIKDREKIVAHIESGHFQLKQDRKVTLAHTISGALSSAILISDLGIRLLRNRTDYPFIFGDSPVIFYNTHYYGVKKRGVLGLQTPGLQIFIPLDSNTLLMFIDEKVYSGRIEQCTVFDVLSRSDVSQLNALQLHHSLNAIYFADKCHAYYVDQLWNAHKSTFQQPEAVFNSRDDLLVDGIKPEGQLYHSFEPHLPCCLDLSFIKCHQPEEKDYKFSYRDKELYEEHKGRFASELDVEESGQ